MGSRFDIAQGDVAQVMQRRQLAAERRRLLSYALHSEPANDFDDMITDRFEPLPRHLIDEEPAPEPATPLAERVQLLREQAAACRAQAIALNAKLVLLEAEHARLRRDTGEVHAVREQLIEGSARLDHAVEEIRAVASVEQQLEDSLR